MKLKKIRNVDKEVCVGEQMIAYNIAFRCHINRGRKYEELPESERETFIMDYALFLLEGDESLNKFNKDAIKMALKNGLNNYMKKMFIANDYEKVGNGFPLNEAL